MPLGRIRMASPVSNIGSVKLVTLSSTWLRPLFQCGSCWSFLSMSAALQSFSAQVVSKGGTSRHASPGCCTTSRDGSRARNSSRCWW